jgi:hypothetical protein
MNHRTAFVLAALAFVPAPPARAADILFDFNAGNDSGLTHYDVLAPFGSGSTFTFPGGDTYRLTSGPSADPNTLGPTRLGAYLPGQTFADFRESVDIVNWDPALDQAIGLAARLSNIGLGTSNGYNLHYNNLPNDVGSAGLVIDRVDGEAADAFAFTQLNLTDPTAGYRLVFTGIGATLTGEIFALSDLNTALASVTLIDSTYASGLTGVLSTGLYAGANTGVDATYDNFRLQSVPEPGSVILLGIGVVGLLAALGRYPRRAS